MSTAAVIVDQPASRAKACNECRQHKLRCDADRDTNQSCSRCLRRGLQCVRSANFRRVKRQTKAQLQAEVEQLKQKVQTSSDQIDLASSSTTITSPQSVSNSFHGLAAYDVSTSHSPEDGRVDFTHPSHRNSSISMLQTPIRTASVSLNGLGSYQHDAVPATPRTLNEIDVDGIEIDDCFTLYYEQYASQFQVLQYHVNPDTCYSLSPFLFWTIVATGARRYSKNPILISSLAPEVENLAKLAVFAREGALYTLQAIILLLVWPMPVDSLSKEIGPMLIGTALQLAVAIGLHVYGVGQDFSRIKVASDRAQMDYRARLWAILITVCQRSNCTDGIPPISIPDTQDHVFCKRDLATAIPPDVRFEKELSAIQVEAILEIERNALSRLPQNRSPILNNIIQSTTTKLACLQQGHLGFIQQFYLLCARLQVSLFYLFDARSAIQDEKLIEVFDLACSAIELIKGLEEMQNFSSSAPLFVSKYLHLSAFTLLKLSRCHLKQSLDLARGRAAYYFCITYNRNASVVTGDICSRASTILPQLWTSKKIFTRADGTFDSLSLRCGSRLAMSPAFDAYWWWRSEFGGRENPYEDRNDNANSGHDNEMDTHSSTAEQSSYPTTYWSPNFPWSASQWPMTGDTMPIDWSNLNLELDPDLSVIPIPTHLSDLSSTFQQPF